MKAIKNIDKNEIAMPFEGNTYLLPMGGAFMVEDDLYVFLQERLPMSFDFKYKVAKDKPVAKVKSQRTPSLIPTAKDQDIIQEDMRVSAQAMPTSPDITPPSGTVDKDGVEWYGEGVQISGGQN